MKTQIKFSTLGHTWILDLDGTILKHNGYKIDGFDTFLPGAKDFLNSISKNNMVIFITSRNESYREQTIGFLNTNNIHFDAIIFNAPFGERVLINDKKESGLKTAICINTERDKWPDLETVIDKNL